MHCAILFIETFIQQHSPFTNWKAILAIIASKELEIILLQFELLKETI